MTSLIPADTSPGSPPSVALPEPTRQLRVLHVQPGLQYGGIQRMLVCLAESHGLCPALESVFALCFEEQLARELAEKGAELRFLGPARMSQPRNLWKANQRLHALLAAEHFDAVVCHGSPPLAMFGFTVRSCRVPLVYWMHNDVKTRNKNVAEFLVRRQCPDLVIANSEFTAASLPLQFAKIPRHVVIPCPVTPSGQRPQTTAERESIRAQMETPPDAVTIVLVGRPEAWKGHALLLEALARLRALPDWICWIIGGAFDPVQAAFLEQLKATARDTGIADRIRFVGQRQDVAEFLQAADLFCHPNLTPEPFGIVFIEALYAGLPVVSVNHGGAKEIVDASCGQLVEPNDPGALAAVLEDLIRDANKRVALGRNAPARGAAVSDPSLILAKVHEQLAVLQGIGRAKARSKNCPRETSGPEHEPSQQTVIQ